MERELNEKAFRKLTRRELIKLAPLAVAGVLVAEQIRERLLDKGLATSDAASEILQRTLKLAPTFAATEVVALDKFPYNSYYVDDPEIDLDSWRLEVTGSVSRSGEFSLDQIRSLPKLTQNTRLVCVEGWNVIGNFGGTRLSDFLEFVGADSAARFVELRCADAYYESIDMATALHPQTLLCYEMYGMPLGRGHGAPLRLQTPLKLGYKQAKYLTSLRVTNVLGARRGYWEDQGYSWHGGL